MKLRFLLLTVVGLSCSLLEAVPSAPTERSEGISSTNLADLSLHHLLDVQIATAFGASRREQNTCEAPASTSILTRAELQAFGYRFLAEALQRLPGIYTSNDRHDKITECSSR